MSALLSRLAKSSIPVVVAMAMGIGALPATAMAESRVTFGISVFAPSAPPPPRYERRPPIPRAYRAHPDRVVWVPGHWEYGRDRYYWKSGYYVEARRGQAWRNPEWVRYDKGWGYRQGGWESNARAYRNDRPGPDRNDHDGRDRDHDGRDHDWR